MNTALFIFPHQLFSDHAGLALPFDRVELVEDSLFFGDDQYSVNFHRQKLVFHRATMKAYAQYLVNKEVEVHYSDWSIDILNIVSRRYQGGRVWVMDPVDDVLMRRLSKLAREFSFVLEVLPCQGFINSREDNQAFSEGRKRWLMADFYQWQRRRLDILMEAGKPLGGRWSFDEENRKKVPKKLLSTIPKIDFPKESSWICEAKEYVELHFSDALGGCKTAYYPVTFSEAEVWLEQFLQERFERFGVYEDALVPGNGWLFHSVLTPMLNVGLLTSLQVVSAAIDYAERHAVPLNSLEGFVRQIIGWREFMRLTYEVLGVRMRTSNHWQHHRAMPGCFYRGNSGIVPIDDVIGRLLETGYCHHIERLMVLGGFMFLCEISPDAIYRWFMEMFIDSYDWVMVPNVYAMSQHADGGLITTKPYFSGSSYLRKMGYTVEGEWQKVWDGLYWRWIWLHKDELRTNRRWAMMCSMVERMDEAKRQGHIDVAEEFLDSLV